MFDQLSRPSVREHYAIAEGDELDKDEPECATQSSTSLLTDAKSDKPVVPKINVIRPPMLDQLSRPSVREQYATGEDSESESDSDEALGDVRSCLSTVLNTSRAAEQNIHAATFGISSRRRSVDARDRALNARRASQQDVLSAALGASTGRRSVVANDQALNTRSASQQHWQGLRSSILGASSQRRSVDARDRALNTRRASQQDVLSAALGASTRRRTVDANDRTVLNEVLTDQQGAGRIRI